MVMVFLVRKPKVQALVTLVGRSGKVVFFLLLGHCIPFLVAAPVDVPRQYKIYSTTFVSMPTC